MSDLSDGEKIDIAGDLSAHGDSVRGRMSRVSSVDAMANCANQYMEKKLYIVLISLHGLIRGENMELGRDSDTGGQVKYVVELARALGMMPGVYRVDLLTRQVSAPAVDWTYGEPTEMINLTGSLDAMHEVGESGGAYIIRIPFGPKDKYIPKELLWPHIPEFVDGALSHIVQMSKVLGEQTGSGQPLWPVVIHGHYADAGESAALLSGALNVPMVLTGHSLGRDKLEQLLKQGRQPKEEINATYKIMRRIEAEELSLDVSEMIITSTRQEIEEQWNLYDGFDPKLEHKLRERMKRNVSCYGRFMPRAMVIPPGMEFHHIVAHEGDMDGEAEGNEHNVGSADPPVWLEIMCFFTNPHKPMILALARPDPKKNLITLVKAFGECRQLRELANLAAAHGLPIVATKNGGPVDIHRVLENGLLVDPHDQHSVADALLKLVADKQLWARCRDNGLRNIHLFSWPEHYKTYLARVMSCKQRQPRWKRDEDECSESEPDSPGDSLRDIKDLSLSLKLSLDGDKNEKSGTTVTALDFVENASKKKSQLDNMVSTLPVNRSMEKEEQSNFQLSRRRKLIVIAVDCDTPAGLADVTQTIIETVKKDKSASSIGFLLSTALTITEVLSFLELSKFKPRDFDAYICNSGGEVYYPCLNSEVKSSGPSFTVDSDYQTHIDYRWGGEDLRKTIIRWEDSINDKVKNKAEIAIKEIDSASAHCFSFRINDQSLVSPVKEVRRLLRIQALRCHAIYCQSGSRLNVIPVLASRSQALRYMFIRWGINLSNLVVFAEKVEIRIMNYWLEDYIKLWC